MKFPTSQAPSANHSATQRSFMMQNAKASQQSGRCITDFELPVRERLSVSGERSQQPVSFAATSAMDQFYNASTPDSVPSPTTPDVSIKNDGVSQHKDAPTSATEKSMTPPHLLPFKIPPTLTPEQCRRWSEEEIEKDRIATGADGGIT
jgi:hypothetical protein